MISIKIGENSIEARGHAKEHLICNTVSTIMWSLVTCLDASQTKGITNDEDNGYQRIAFVPSEASTIIFKGFTRCLRELASAYPDDVRVV